MVVLVVMPDQSPSEMYRHPRAPADSLPAAALKLLRNYRKSISSTISEEPVGYEEERNGGVQQVVPPRSEPFREARMGSYACMYVHGVHACRCLFWTPVYVARWDRKPVLPIHM